MLNMLIAIMSDTFEQLIEKRELNSVKTRISVVSELSGNIDADDEADSKRFLYVITPDEDENVDFETWEGSIN